MNNTPMILGLDVSSSKIGIAVLDLDKKIVSTDLLKFKPETPLEERAKLFENKLAKLKKYYFITHVFVEEPFIAFGGGKTTAHTMAKLQRFNGMCSYGVYNIFESLPIMVNVRVARSNLGIKIPKGTKQNDTKKFIIEYVERNHTEFTYNKTAQGNPVPGTDDKADAIVIALYGLQTI
jgi:RNase H-fold protein (predicted Holliday junction resolvase)